MNWIKDWLSNRKQRVVLNGKCSSWATVLSGVPQLLFLVFINNINELARALTILKKFADDTKGGKTIKSEYDRDFLQRCLDNLFNWAEEWGMSFNVNKCKILHIGRTNPRYEYNMNNIPLKSVQAEKDIGVWIDSSLKPNKQCAEASRTGNAVLGKILRAFHYRDKHTFLNLYKQHVRPHLEFCSAAWSPWSPLDTNLIEKVQMRAVKAISGLKSTIYEERLKELNLQSLNDRRIRTDLIQVFKILNEVDRVDQKTWFTTMGESAQRMTRLAEYEKNLVGGRSRTEVRRNFFSQRVVSLWNNVPTNIKQQTTLSKFKRELDRHQNNS